MVTPTPGRQGEARVTITVTDADGNTASGTFQVTVGVPHLSPFPDQSTPHDTVLRIPFRVDDAEGDPLTLWASSTNEVLLPAATVRFAGTGSSRTIELEPAPGLSGLSRISVFLSDGFTVASNQFLLTVFPTRGSLLEESFSYADGAVTTNSQFAWTTHSASAGQTGQTQVVQGRLRLSGSQSEDIHRGLTGAPYNPEGAWMLYAGMTVVFTARPAGNGDYFAHFRGLNSGSAARLFATTTGSAPGRVRLGVANNATDADATLPLDLETNVAYHVVTRLNVATGQTTLWVNPTAESDSGAVATDNPSTFPVWSYAFRQAPTMGSMMIDDLQVGTSFADVNGYRIDVQWADGLLELSWPEAAQTAGFRLQSSSAAGGSGWEAVGVAPELDGDRLVLLVSFPGAGRFFRLSK